MACAVTDAMRAYGESSGGSIRDLCRNAFFFRKRDWMRPLNGERERETERETETERERERERKGERTEREVQKDREVFPV